MTVNFGGVQALFEIASLAGPSLGALRCLYRGHVDEPHPHDLASGNLT